MALRFRRSIKLAPGLRLNLSKSGASLSAGPPGASVTFGSRGVYGNAGIPGTGGLYSRSRLGAAPASAPELQPGKVAVGATIRVEDDGTVKFLDEGGQPLSDYLTNLAKRQQGAKIKELLVQTSDRINGEVEALQKLHEFTPAPDEQQKRAGRDFPSPRPTRATPRQIGFFDRLFGKRAAIEAENQSQQAAYVASLASWEAEKAAFQKSEVEQSRLFDQRLRTDTDFMQQLLEQNLQDISWPRETLVSFEISSDAREVAIDVDLPELEDMPTRITSVPERGYKLSVKQIKRKQLNELYSRLVHDRHSEQHEECKLRSASYSESAGLPGRGIQRLHRCACLAARRSTATGRSTGKYSRREVPALVQQPGKPDTYYCGFDSIVAPSKS